MPRPRNADGLPIPYVAAAPDRLGDIDLRRVGKVLRSDLCQVCGERVTEPMALTITRDEEHWPDRWLQGLLHDECARVAFRHCPVVRAFDAMALYKVAVRSIVHGADRVDLPPVEDRQYVDPAEHRHARD